MLKTRQTTIGKVQNIKSWSQQGDGGQTETVPQKNYGQTMLKGRNMSSADVREGGGLRDEPKECLHLRLTKNTL